MARPPLLFIDWLHANANSDGTRVAVVDASGSFTYADLMTATSSVAAGLVDRGLLLGEPVALAMAPSAAYLATYLGVLEAGGVPTPVNTRLTINESDAYLTRIQPSMAIHDASFAALFAGLAERVGSVRSVIAVDVTLTSSPAASLATQLQSLWATPRLLPAVSESDPAVIFPTGGTTGLPKGAYTDHRGLMLWVWNVAFSTRRHRNEVELFFMPFFHVSLVVGILAPLFAGGTVVIERTFDVDAAIDTITRHGVTRLMGAPTMFTALGNHPAARSGAFDSVRDVVFGAAASTEAFVSKLMDDFPNAQIVTGYGATEFASSVSRITFEDLQRGRLVGVGRPNSGAQIIIVDNDGERVADGVIGEIAVRSPWQTVGYWNQPEETAATYRADGFILLGDLGYFDDDGWLYVSGRKKEMIITGGENVFPIEIESALTAQPGVAEAVAFGIDDEFWGERIEAVVTVKPGATLDVEGLRSASRDVLAGYKVPKKIHVVDAIPLTANNKPDRITLRRTYSA